MEELLKINHDTEQPTVSARDLHEALDKCEDFSEFFVSCSKMKVGFNRENLKTLINVLRMFYEKYGAEIIAYLIDTIQAEMVLPCKTTEKREKSEANMKKQILNNINKIFPDFNNIESEKTIDGIGRVDIYAEKNGTPVIIELKTGKKNPNQQLLSYGASFDSPILIGITELPLGQKQKIPDIVYYSFHELMHNL